MIVCDDFFANNILPADSAAVTVVEGLGKVAFDVTSIVNDWIGGSNVAFSIALIGTTDTLNGNGFLYGFANNTEAPESSFITIVPEPASAAVSAAAGLGWSRSDRLY